MTTIHTGQEYFGAGVTRRWHQPGRLVIYSVTQNNRDAVDAYVEAVSEVVKLWEPEKTLLSVHHFGELQLILTPYARKRITDLTRDSRHLVNDHKAIVIPRSFGGDLARLFVNTHLNRYMPGKTHIFHDLDESITWLNSLVERV